MEKRFVENEDERDGYISRLDAYIRTWLKFKETYFNFDIATDNIIHCCYNGYIGFEAWTPQNLKRLSYPSIINKILRGMNTWKHHAFLSNKSQSKEASIYEIF